MYEPHADIQTPPDDTVIWRYIDLEKLLAVLNSGTLYLCRLDRFRDPWEGLLPPAVLDAIRREVEKLNAKSAESFVTFANALPKSFFVSCWHENPVESAAFWERYGGSRGFAIKSTIGRLKTSSRSATTFYIGRVQYLNYDRPKLAIKPFNLLMPAFLKRRSFEHEREVRVLAWDVPVKEEKVPVDWSAAKESQELDVDLTVLMESVYVSPASAVWLPDAVRGLLRRFSLPDVRVSRSEIYDRNVA
jgi:hypothetical protein